MHVLRGQDGARASIKQCFHYILNDLLTELYDYPDREQLEFPSGDVMDMLGIHDGIEYRRVQKALHDYGCEIRSVCGEYSLMSLSTIRPYLNCNTVGRGDLLLRRTPRIEHELPV